MRITTLEEKVRQSRITNAAFDAVRVDPALGVVGASYKWRQTLTHVEVYVPLPPGTMSKDVLVELTPTFLRIVVQERQIIAGELFRAIKCDESTWFIQVWRSLSFFSFSTSLQARATLTHDSIACRMMSWR